MTKHQSTKAQERFIGMFPFEFASKAEKTSVIPDMVHLVPIGQWEHDLYGPIMITASDIGEFIQNFNANVRKGVYITAGHEGYEELPAQGWITMLESHDDGLWGKVEWNELGKETLKDKQFKFISPEFYRDYEDPQTHQIYRNVLIGAALTKSPYFKELNAVVFSDKAIKNQFNENNNNDMNLADLLAKDIATLTDDEKAFIKANAEQLTEEQKVSHATIIAEAAPAEEAPATETPAEETPAEVVPATETPATETPAADPAPEAETPAETPAEETPATETPAEGSQVNASEKVLVSASEHNKFKEAFAELNKMKLDSAVKELVFSEGNQAGRFLPKSSDNLRAFMEKLNDGQISAFKALINEMPKAGTHLFSEIGTGADTSVAGTAKAAMDSKIAELRAENPKMTYGDALKKVATQFPDLAKAHDAEVKGK